MSQPYPPPQQPQQSGQPQQPAPSFGPPQPVPPGQNPYAQQSPAPAQQAAQGPQAPQNHQAPGAPYGAPQPGQPFPPGPAFVPQGPAAVRGNLGLGILGAIAASLVTAGVYGWLMSAIEREVSYAAIAVGFLVGFAAGKAGGNHPALAPVAAVLSLGAVYAGQLFGVAMLAAKDAPWSATKLLTDHFGLVQEAWKTNADFLTYAFIAIAAFAAFAGAKKAAA